MVPRGAGTQPELNRHERAGREGRGGLDVADGDTGKGRSRIHSVDHVLCTNTDARTPARSLPGRVQADFRCTSLERCRLRASAADIVSELPFEFRPSETLWATMEGLGPEDFNLSVRRNLM